MSKHRSHEGRLRRRVLVSAAAVLLSAGVGLPAMAMAASADDPDGGHSWHAPHPSHRPTTAPTTPAPTPAASETAVPAAPAPAPAPPAAPAAAPAAPAAAPAPAAPAAAPAPVAVVAPTQPALVLPAAIRAEREEDASTIPAAIGGGIAIAAVAGFAWLLAAGRARRSA